MTNTTFNGQGPLALWEAELRAGVNGQNRNISATWVMDGLYLAACYEINAKEMAEESRRAMQSGNAYAARIWRILANEEWRKSLAALAAMTDVPDDPDVAPIGVAG